jgi:hypothetical protein
MGNKEADVPLPFTPSSDVVVDRTWPQPHPIPCGICGRALTDAEGIALVAIRITDRWVCASHDEEQAF